MIPTDIGLVEKDRQEIVQQIEKVLGTEYAWYTKLLKFHWNVEGPFFGPLHKFFEDLYKSAFEDIDKLAERARALGFKPAGTLREFADISVIKEQPGVNPSDTMMLKELLGDAEILIKLIRDAMPGVQKARDEATANMFADMIEHLEKQAWMLRAHLQSVSKNE